MTATTTDSAMDSECSTTHEHGSSTSISVTDQQLGEGGEVKSSKPEAVASSSVNEDEADEKMEEEEDVRSVVEVESKSVSEMDIDNVSLEDDKEMGTQDGLKGEEVVAGGVEAESNKEESSEDIGIADNLSTGTGSDKDSIDGTSKEGDGTVEGGNNDTDNGITVKDTHQQQEDELEAYLESLKPKPKRKSVKEMLMSMAGYKDIVGLKPKIGGDEKKDKKDIIFLDDEVVIRRMSKKQQQIEALKDRFVKHALIAPPKSAKGEHVKLKINKKEEDSQGIEHLVENEVDYVRNPLNEEEDAVTNVLVPLSTSPQGDRPGAKYSSLRQTLLGNIRKQKMKDYEERLQQLKNDNEEEEEKEESEEEMEENGMESGNDTDADSDDEGNDEDESEDENEGMSLDDLLKGPKEEKVKKSAYVEDEAEDDDDVSSDEESDNNDSGSNDGEGENDKDTIGCDKESKTDDKSELESIGGDSQCSFPAPSLLVSENKEQEEATPVKRPENENSASMDFGVDVAPKAATTMLNPSVSSAADFWYPVKANIDGGNSDGLSPLIPKIQRKADFVEMEECQPVNTETSVRDSLANVISKTNTKFDDLVDLCSGKFLTQPATEQKEIADDDDEFGNFDFGDDDPVEENNKSNENNECVKTPVAVSTRTAVDGVTPKLAATEKPTIARRSMQFEVEMKDDVEKLTNKDISVSSESAQVNLDDEDEEIVVTRRSIGKKKRLQFSDDEDDGDNEKGAENQIPEVEESEDDMEDVEESPELPKAKAHNPMINKYGQLKKKFLEMEAELSGSDASDDEDEKGLDDYEGEEGDDECLDEDQVNYLARVHRKYAGDEEQRYVKHLENRFVPDGDLHVDQKRGELRFTFKTNDLNDDAVMGLSDEEGQAEDTPEEALAKKEWLEKRKWMSENSHLLEANADESQSLLTSFKIGKQTIRRIESFADTSTSESKDLNIKKRQSFLEEFFKAKQTDTKTSSKQNDSASAFSEGFNFGSVGKDKSLSLDESSKSMSEPMFGEAWTKSTSNGASSKKGSFLSRGGLMLAKLAETSKPGDTVSNVKNNSRNFVFSHITPPNPEKTDGSTSRVKRPMTKSSCNAQAKKIKVDRSFHSLDETSKQSSVFQFL